MNTTHAIRVPMSAVAIHPDRNQNWKGRHDGCPFGCGQIDVE